MTARAILNLQSHSSYQLVQPDDLEWGREVDGRWTGLLGLLVNKRVDLVISPLTVNADRAAVVDYSVPYFYDKIVTVVRKPDSNQSSTTVFTWPVYVCILCSLMLSSLCVFCLDELFLARNAKPKGHQWKRCSYTLAYFLSSLFRQGCLVPSSLAGRTMLWFWLLLNSMLVAIYSGALIASLAETNTKPPFTTIEELVDQNTYTWGFFEGTHISEVFRTSSLKEYRAVWEGSNQRQTGTSDMAKMSLAWHMEQVMKNRYVFIGDLTSIISYKNLSCNHYITDLHIGNPFFAMGFQKRSSLTPIFSQKVMEIYESGLLTLWYEQSVPTFHCKPTIGKPKRVDLQTLQYVFFSVGAAVLLASVMLTGEIVVIKLKRLRK